MTVQEASACLREAVCDFPFATESHLSAWICSVLTPLALYAFKGPAPLFLFEAPTAGSGKTYLATIAGIIGTGKAPAPMTYSPENAEMRKIITTHAMNPKPLVFMDNIEGKLGGPSMNMLLTSPDRVWSDRVLGGNTGFRGEVNTVWYATGNNAELAPDMERRVCPIRIEPTVVRPELRGGWKHDPIMPWVRANADCLRWACLTLLRASQSAGLVGWGSFESWRDLVVGAALAGGFGTPDAAVKELREDEEKSQEGEALVSAWLDMVRKHGEQTSKDAYALCYPNVVGAFGRPSEGCEALRNLLDSRYPKGCTAKGLGYLLRDYKGRVFSTGKLVIRRTMDKRFWNVA